MHNGLATRGYTLHDFTIGRITDNSGLQTTFHITPPRTSRCPVSCSLIGCRSSPMYFSIRNTFTQQDFESQKVTGPDIWDAKYFTGGGKTSAILSDHIFDNSHCMIVTRVNEHRFASDFGHLSAISHSRAIIGE